MDQKNQNPADEVLAMLEGIDMSNVEYLLDFTSLKPSRLRQGYLERLLAGLPHSDVIQYSIALPDKMISEANRLAQDYVDAITDAAKRPKYNIINKQTATMLVNQR